MPRVPPPKAGELSERHRKLVQEIGATPGGGIAAGGPWALSLRNAELCERGAAGIGIKLK